MITWIAAQMQDHDQPALPFMPPAQPPSLDSLYTRYDDLCAFGRAEDAVAWDQVEQRWYPMRPSEPNHRLLAAALNSIQEQLAAQEVNG